MKKLGFLSLVLTIAMFSGCSFGEEEQGLKSSDSDVQTSVDTSDDTSDMFTSRDKEIGYDESTSAIIQLNGDTAECSSDAVSISGSTVTVTDEGTYIFSGTLNGMIIVDANNTDKTQLVLNGVTINSETSAAIYVKQADKVFITMAEGSENTLLNGGQYTDIDENSIDSVVFSKDDLTLNGSGTMTVSAEAGHGIVSKDDLVITSGTYNVTAANHGLSANDSVRVADGTVTITSGKDGIQAENSDDTTLGFIYIAGGTINITSDGDGMSASAYLQTDGGEISITSGEGSANADTYVEEFQRGFGMSDSTSSSTSDISAKGLKAEGEVLINSGTFNIDSADDAIHSNLNVTINGGTSELASGDDGIHADSILSITAGTINISKSYEGIEGETVNISGGEISLKSSDDGINASGGTDESGFGGRFGGGEGFGGSNGEINITGGKLFVDADGDGIDSNGNLYVSGGEIYVSGPTNGGNDSIDYDGEAVISGGILVAAGSSQMAQNFGSASTQGVMRVTVSSQQGGIIELLDSSENVLISFETEKSFDSVIISCPEITTGSTYTLTAGSSRTEITMQSLVFSSGGSSGGFGGKPGMQRR